MWARVVEFMIGCWLGMSPFIFQHATNATLLWITDFSGAILVMVFSVLSYWSRMRHAHLAIVLVAAGLIVVGRFATGSPIPPAGQNQILVGLLLLMFAIVPNRASRPPLDWANQTSPAS